MAAGLAVPGVGDAGCASPVVVAMDLSVAEAGAVIVGRNAGVTAGEDERRAVDTAPVELPSFPQAATTSAMSTTNETIVTHERSCIQ